MTPKPATQTVTTSGIYITKKTAKTAKTGSTYWIFDSSVGSLVCFDEDLAANIDQSDEIAYSFKLAEPTGTFKWKQIKAIAGQETKPRPKPVAPPAQAPAQAQDKRPYTRPYDNASDKSSVFEEKDHRISKLSVFSSVVNLMAAKARSDFDFAKKNIEDMLLDAVTYANMVTEEFIYGVPRPPTTDGSRPSPTETASLAQPTQPEAPRTNSTPIPEQSNQRVYTPPPAAQYVPPTTPPPAPAAPTAPVEQPASPTVQVSAPAATTQMTADAGKLFGAGGDLEAKMAERLRALTSRAKS